MKLVLSKKLLLVCFFWIFSIPGTAKPRLTLSNCVWGTFEKLDSLDEPLSLATAVKGRTDIIFAELEKSIRMEIPQKIQHGYLTIKAARISPKNTSKKLFKQISLFS